MGLVDSAPAGDEEMFSLTIEFATWRHRRPATLVGVATSIFREKRPRRSSSDEEARKDRAIALEGEVPAVNPLSVEEVGMCALSRVVISPAPPHKPTRAGLSKKRLPDRVLLSTYVPLLERVHPSANMVTPNLEDVLKIFHRWSPLNQEESPVTRMQDLYPNYFRMPMTARSE